MPEMPAPPPMPEMPAPPPMPEMPAPPPMPETPAPPPMPDVEIPMESGDNNVDEAVELPDPLAALDILSDTPSSPVPIEDKASEGEPELSVADYKWKDSVLEAVIEKFNITDRDAFLVHATAFDANNNLYITKNEFTQAAKEWVELTTPIAELESVEAPAAEVAEEPLVNPDTLLSMDSEEESIEEGSDVEDVVAVEEPSQPELPPLPAEPPLPAPPAMELPPLPAPAPEATVEVQEIPASAEPEAEVSEPQTEDYRELWKRRSDKSLPQMYGAIDRIGSGEIGSLLDRYSDRFGHELDREIIVMRRAEQDARREAVPVVELISAPEEADEGEDEDDELSSQLAEVENLLRPLQNAYKSTDDKSEKKRLAPALKALIAERKILISVISGDEDEDALEDIPERPEIPDLDDAGDEDDDDEDEDEVTDSSDEFADFFNIINQLLGDMPENWVTNFVESKGFALFQKVGENPAAANEKTRKKFFNMINNELGSMPEDMLDTFVASPEFELYKSIGEMYGE